MEKALYKCTTFFTFFTYQIHLRSNCSEHARSGKLLPLRQLLSQWRSFCSHARFFAGKMIICYPIISNEDTVGEDA